MLLEDLRKVELFADLSEEQFICSVKGDIVELEKGEILFHEGDTATRFFVILEGVLQVHRVIKGQKVPITEFREGDTGGEVALLSGTPHLGTGIAVTALKILNLDEEGFWNMMGNCKAIRQRILANMADRMQQLQLLSFQREKMVALGTIAAGLAHELNNPASAAKRSAQKLGETLKEFNVHSAEMLKWVMFNNTQSTDFADSFPFQTLVGNLKLRGVELDVITRSACEDEMMEWLESVGVDQSWEVAPALVNVGYTKEFLKTFCENLVPGHVPGFLEWLYYDVELRMIAHELIQSTDRISEVITAMKSYSFMDKNMEKVRINLHEGIDNTLLILNFQLKDKNIKVVKEYDNNLPQICAFGSELNQVWTNLIDNAIDAVPRDGQITIKTYLDEKQPGMVCVEIIDNGSGIPGEIQNQIFEPFFTTKEVGKGSGIGLDICYRIVVDQHQGCIILNSEVGKTVFKVSIPVELETELF